MYVKGTQVPVQVRSDLTNTYNKLFTHCFAFRELFDDTIKTHRCFGGQCNSLIGLTLKINLDNKIHVITVGTTAWTVEEMKSYPPSLRFI